MKRISRLSLLFFGLCFMSIFYSNPAAVFAQATYAIEDAVMAEKGAEENLVSLDFKDADLKDVMKVFSQQSGLNFISSKGIETRKITLYMEDVLVEDALNALLLANNLGLQQSPESNIIIVKAKPTLPVETITKVYKLRHFHDAAPPGMLLMGGGGAVQAEGMKVEQFIKPLLSEYGKFVSYASLILITDVPDRFKLIDQVISEIDKPIPEVMIEVELIETTSDFLEQMGVKFASEFADYSGPARDTAMPYTSFKSNKLTADEPTFSYGRISSSALRWTLEMLQTDVNTKFLSKPRILVQNREWAELKIIADQVVSVKTTTTGSGVSLTVQTEVERMEVGTILRLLPVINEEEGYVSILLEPSVSRPKNSAFGDGEVNFVDPQTRSLRTVVMVGDGETVAIGGFITTEDQEDKTKVPWLGDIPLIGALFRHRRTNRVDKELLIFITPRIVIPTDKVSMWIEGGAPAPQQEAPTAKPQPKVKPKAEKVQPEKSESVPLPVSRKIKLPFREQEGLKIDLTLKAAGAGFVDLVK